MGDGAAAVEALEAGDAEGLERLLAQDPGLARARDAAGVSLLLAALYRGRRDLAAVVRAAGAPLDGFEATAVDDVARLDEVLAADPSFVRARSPDGFTALHLAAFFGGTRAAARLLAAGAEPSAVADNASAVQPLHSAVAGRHDGIVRALLEAGADVDARQRGGYTPLHGAAAAGDVDAITLLLRHGATADVRDDSGATPRDLAERAGQVEAARALSGV